MQSVELFFKHLFCCTETFARGLGVRFYGDLKGYMPYDLLGVASPKEALQKYLVGDILRVYVTGFSATKRWISLSLRKPSKKEMEPRVSRNNAEPSVDLASCSGGSLWPGDLVQARFSKVGSVASSSIKVQFTN